jgi:6-phospho-beta-glucosidase
VVPLVVTLKAYEDMLIDASFNKDKNQLLKSLIMHPLIPTYATAKSLLEDVLRVNDPYLDWFKS